ncbi:beta-adaptin [Scheffersomyces spartinae]|uniref:AP complex subunit beta n=1 Tax=Scheffersomyces spartinae TaxID=45513 RepID=A0A9P7VAM6_9ASCO|nr:beta-adaptin [Scheffersomyces spartinae]KAG7193899.1 beta-adaptin [Scheffersomyces spartinae]
MMSKRKLEQKIKDFIRGPLKGETYELKAGLVSQYEWERKDSIQRVIQAMTVGKDVSSLFPDVLKNIATYDIEQKKLVYLYLMNYAKTNPELCILAVNTFVQDATDPNPLIRALAIRTMGCIRVEKMVDYMEIPLRRTLKDDNPYVRKTAAICVAKLFDLNPVMCVELGFLDDLKALVKDSNPMVAANAVTALFEIRDMNRDPNLEVFVVTTEVAKILLFCLNECTEWGRITILTALTDYKAKGPEEANHIIERVIPQLQHVNPSIVLSSIKAIIHHLDSIRSTNSKNLILKKLAAPLVSLVSASIPEAQYVGLKNIRIILEKYPQILSKELRVFFIKYSDPLYLKLEKLDIMVRLANEANCALLLGELKEYAMEFEPSLIVRAIKCIGSVAVKLPVTTIKAINLLTELIEQRGGDLIINESVAALTKILRRYPGKNDLITVIIPVISNQMEDLSTNESISGYVWLLGEYPKYFSQLHDKLSLLVESFLDYDPTIQLNILNSTVKINLVISDKNLYQGLLQQVLEKATKECENADVRDKAFIYWRLLSSSSSEESKKKILLTKLPPMSSAVPSFSPAILEILLKELATLSSVYHKPAYTFIDPSTYAPLSTERNQNNSNDKNIEDLANLAKQEIINNAKNENLLDFDDDEDQESTRGDSGGLLDELNDLFITPNAPQAGTVPPNTTNNNDILSLFGAPSGAATTSTTTTTTTSKSNLNNDLLDIF